MSAIEYGRFQRVLLRCAELAAEAGMKASVVRMHDETLRPWAEAYLEAQGAVVKAGAAFRKEHRGAAEALAAFDAPYREAHRVVRAFAPEAVLPDTLKAQPTDTDKLNALDQLLDTLDDHSGEAWADEIAEGALGQRAAAAVREMNEAIAADMQFAQARDARAAAYGPAYERYLRFKRLVRDALGSKSRQYKRIHLRTQRSAAEDGPVTRPDPVVVRLPVEAASPPSQRALGPASSRLGEARPS